MIGINDEVFNVQLFQDSETDKTVILLRILPEIVLVIIIIILRLSSNWKFSLSKSCRAHSLKWIFKESFKELPRLQVFPKNISSCRNFCHVIITIEFFLNDLFLAAFINKMVILNKYYFFKLNIQILAKSSQKLKPLYNIVKIADSKIISFSSMKNISPNLFIFSSSIIFSFLIHFPSEMCGLLMEKKIVIKRKNQINGKNFEKRADFA